MNIIIRGILALLVINQLLSPCSAFGGYGRSYSKEATGYKDPAEPDTFVGSSLGQSAGRDNATHRGLGISAWGIVVVIVTLILTGTGLYYLAMCYPILCKKSRKYDIIGLPAVA